ncbi:hypothetical protein VTI74DRAFT_3023 [Chaetomium olivicolor]
MAGTPYDIHAPGGSYAFDIYNDTHALRAGALALPSGPCNYTDQTLPRCGCRRFWSRASLNGAFRDNPVEVCMCSHHACFHEDAPAAQTQPGQTQPLPVTNAGGQENQRPKTSREPLSPVMDLQSFHMPASLGSALDFNLLDFQTSVSAPRIQAANPSQVQDARPGQESPMPDTYASWGDLARSQAGHANGLPPIPPQCLMSPPPPPSTASSSQGRYLRPFAGKGLGTLSGVSAPRPPSRLRVNEDAGLETIEEPGHAPTEAASTPKGLRSQEGPGLGFDAESIKRLEDRVDTHEQRLDRLETNSFSVAGHDDCHDKHEHLDLRVTDLESRVDEMEKLLNDSGSVVSSRRAAKPDAGADDATASVASVSTNATITAANRAEVYSQLQQLQAQVTQLQAAALPSYTKPWELEVVFLPFPLKGIWIEAKDFTSRRRSIGSNVDDWTQMPNTISRATPDPHSPKFQEWAGQGPESNWLLPRAFAAGRVIDQRLKSRGLIKTVLIRGADARSVQLAVHDAFGDILRICHSDTRFAQDYPLAEFLGLRQAWVPLRKLHKDSRLRFLSPAEMSTPALWDFTFLVSSVVMKATGVQRLYITQPEAYLQDHPLGHHAFETGWTWQKLRQLSRVYPDSQSSTGDVPEADALEECWNWNDRLDEPPTPLHASSTISLRQSIHQRASRRSSTEPSQQFYTGVSSPILSVAGLGGPSRSRAQSPLIQRERKGSWPPPHSIRTGSLPPVGPALISPAQSRRRISTHATPYERRSSPFVPARANPRLASPRMGSMHATSAAVAIQNPNKRRFTRSPSLVPRNTPRWSRTSMSRSPSLAPGGIYGYEEREQRDREQRRTTPFYYATPHSEAVGEFGYHRAGSRGPPALLRTNTGYDDDDEDEDMNYLGEDGESTGSGTSTDPYDDEDGDSEMTSDDPQQLQHQHQHYSAASRQRSHPLSHSRQNSSHHGHHRPFPFVRGATAEVEGADLDIDVYEDEDDKDELDGVDTDAGGGGGGQNSWRRRHHHHQPGSSPQQQQHQGGPGPLRPEDIPWAGIEDVPEADLDLDLDEEGDSNMSDSENVDPLSSQEQEHEISIHEDEDVAEAQHGMEVVRAGGENEEDVVVEEEEEEGGSSQAPSEYSSKRGAWQIVPLAAAADADAAVGVAAEAGAGVEGKNGPQSQVMGFRIHEDGTAGEGLLDTQWA